MNNKFAGLDENSTLQTDSLNKLRNLQGDLSLCHLKTRINAALFSLPNTMREKKLAPYRAFAKSEYLGLMVDVFQERLIQLNPSAVITNEVQYITPIAHLHLLAHQAVAGAAESVNVNKEVTLSPK